MLAFTDVHYGGDEATAACIVANWGDDEAAAEHRAVVSPVAPYEPGKFYLRELPCLRAVLEQVEFSDIHAIVIDGYVWLSGDERPGLGAHLWEALEGVVPVIGVAKNAFRGSEFAVEVYRGESSRPLYVTARGYDPVEAADRVAEMAGAYRIPTLLRRVDQLSREP